MWANKQIRLKLRNVEIANEVSIRFVHFPIHNVHFVCIKLCVWAMCTKLPSVLFGVLNHDLSSGLPFIITLFSRAVQGVAIYNLVVSILPLTTSIAMRILYVCWVLPGLYFLAVFVDEIRHRIDFSRHSWRLHARFGYIRYHLILILINWVKYWKAKFEAFPNVVHDCHRNYLSGWNRSEFWLLF